METTRVTGNGLEFEVLQTGDGDRIALLLHGFPDDAGSMTPLMKRLAEAGYSAIAPYMRGYGNTESPDDGDYSVGALARDVTGLLEAFDAADALLVGHDWGAAAAQAAARFADDRIAHLVTLAVPPGLWEAMAEHPVQAYRSWYMAFFCLPGLPERAIRANDYALIERLWREWSPGWDVSPDRVEAVKETFRAEGTVEAALAYYRQNVPPRAGSADADAPGVAVPWLVVAGADDGCIGPELFAGGSGADRVEVLSGVGHFMQCEAPGTLGDLLVSFAGSPS